MTTNRTVTETKRANERPLTPKQQLFVEAYFASKFNASEAARQAGYKADANTQGPRLLANVGVARAISERFNEIVSARQVDANEVLDLLVSHMRGSMEDFVDPDSLALDFKKAQRLKKLHLIKKLRSTTIINNTTDTETHIVEFELYDAQQAAVHLGKHLSLFNDKLQLSVAVEKLSDDELLKLAEGRKP